MAKASPPPRPAAKPHRQVVSARSPRQITADKLAQQRLEDLLRRCLQIMQSAQVVAAADEIAEPRGAAVKSALPQGLINQLYHRLLMLNSIAQATLNKLSQHWQDAEPVSEVDSGPDYINGQIDPMLEQLRVLEDQLQRLQNYVERF